MPIRGWRDETARLLRFEIVGDWTTDEMVHAVVDGLHSIAHETDFDVLSDHSRIGRPATPDEIRRMIVLLTADGSALRGRRGAVVAGGPASYGMLRMLGVHVQGLGIDLRVFESAGDALRWLRPD